MAMIDLMKTSSFASAEADTDRQLADLMQKLADGTASNEDRQLFRELSMKRVRMMRPSVSARIQQVRKAAVCG